PTSRSASPARMPATRSRARVTPAWYAMPTVPPPPKTMPRRPETMVLTVADAAVSRKSRGAQPRQIQEPHRLWLSGGVVVLVVAGGGGLPAGDDGGGGGGGAVGAWLAGGGGAVR